MRSLSLLTDFYNLTTMNAYVLDGMEQQTACFDLFYRDHNGVSLAPVCGIEQISEFLSSLHFLPDEIEYLRSLGRFDESFLSQLENFRFTGDVYAMEEGGIAFPGEPILRVCAPLIQAQLIETALLNILGHQTLIAAKSLAIVRAADGKPVFDFGLRRAQGPDAAIYGTRAGLIAGLSGTSNVLAAKMFSLPAVGTHAHSFVMSYPDELAAFRAYAKTFPDSCTLLVDTYDTLGSGVPNAITVFNELRKAGHEPVGIRLDSGDLCDLSKKARRMLDSAGFPDVKIVASSDLDEHSILQLKSCGAPIDIYGVGTRLITSWDAPSLGAVYKLAGYDAGNGFCPKMKRSETKGKSTLPGVKQVYRLFDRATGLAAGDFIALADEPLPDSLPLKAFSVHGKAAYLDVQAGPALLQPLILNGKPVIDIFSTVKAAQKVKTDMKQIDPRYTALRGAQPYPIYLSKALHELREELLSI